MELPPFMKSSNEIALPKCEMPYTEIALPRRAKLLKLREDPRFTQSRILIPDDIRTNP
jgi:hypothetical protein